VAFPLHTYHPPPPHTKAAPAPVTAGTRSARDWRTALLWPATKRNFPPACGRLPLTRQRVYLVMRAAFACRHRLRGGGGKSKQATCRQAWYGVSHLQGWCATSLLPALPISSFFHAYVRGVDASSAFVYAPPNASLYLLHLQVVWCRASWAAFSTSAASPHACISNLYDACVSCVGLSRRPVCGGDVGLGPLNIPRTTARWPSHLHPSSE